MQQKEALLMDAWWCQWGLMVVFNAVPFANLLQEFKRGPHLPCQVFMVIYSRNLSQFLPPVRHVMHSGSPGHPTLKILCRRFWEGPFPILFPQATSWFLEEMVNLWSQLQWSFQVQIQESLFIFWTPPWRAVFKVRGRALLWLHPAVSPVLSPRFLSAAILPPGVGMGLQLALGDRPAQLLYLFLQGGCSSQSLLMGFSCLGEASLSRSVPPLLGVLLLKGQASVRPGSSILCEGSSPFHSKQSSREDTISAVSSSICSGSPSGDPGSLLSLYTS